MKRMPLSRLFALPLAPDPAPLSAAQALTPDQARELLQDYYIDEVPEDVLDQNTIQAMLEALGDPYTTYFSPEEYGAFTGSMSDTDTVGVGIYSLVTADGPLIQRVYENTPAADAGLQPGDLVTAVDGRSTAGQDAGTVAAWLKGDPGTRVELSYRRDGAEYTAVLTRRAITVPATYTELWDGHIGYIDCDTFGGETVAHFVSGMEDTAAGADHWIVDLRGNGGGEVDAAMGAAGCFTGSGVLAYLKDSTGAYGAYGSNDDARTLSPRHRPHRRGDRQRLRAVRLRHPGHQYRHPGGRAHLRQGSGPDGSGPTRPARLLPRRGRHQDHQLPLLRPLRLHHRHRWPDPPPAGGPRPGPRGRHPSLRLQPQGLHGGLSAYRLQLALVCGAGHRPE